jgi:RNA 3'-terminal phosphate cyclase (ATP)
MADDMLTIDGSQGEGGGQILRSSLALSLVTGRPFRIARIRAGRKRPGLMRQHLTCVQAAAAVGRAEVTGAALGATSLTFVPGLVNPGEYHFAVGTAGSATLVLQTVLPALLCACGPSTLRLEGGTHNPGAPPFDFLAKCFLPLIERMGPRVEARLIRPGFYPAGGGELHVAITPAAELQPIELLDRGEIEGITATAKLARLPRHIAERELKVIARMLGLRGECLTAEEVPDSHGPGNVVIIEVRAANLTEVFTAFGQRGVPAETVAANAAEQARRYIAAEVPVGVHLADQLMLPLALAGGGAFRTADLSLHAQTNMRVVEAFMDLRFDISRDAAGRVAVRAKR